MAEKIIKSDAEWRELLTPEQYHVMREKGTERPFTGSFDRSKGEGNYHCAACGNQLFSSNAKYESGTGWPSFWAPASEESGELATDTSHGMARTEYRCKRCGAHLGHMFADGPAPTGQRYCINSVALKFVGSEQESG